jgi:hypothetical protein
VQPVRGGLGAPLLAKRALVAEEPAGDLAEQVGQDLPLVNVGRRQGEMDDPSGAVDGEMAFEAIIVLVLAGAVAICRLAPVSPQGCSTLLTDGQAEQIVEPSESSPVAVLADGVGLVGA